jgi:hypothetical protein
MLRWLPCLFLITCLSACSSGPAHWTYQYQRGKTATLRGPYAVPPPNLPRRIQGALHAGNSISDKPYRYGGGHRSFSDVGYDCSGAVSYVLRGAGLINRPGTSESLRRYGAAGRGKYITVYSKPGHCFIEVAGLRFDTGYTGHGSGTGPRWTTRPRPLRGFKARHPPGW